MFCAVCTKPFLYFLRYHPCFFLVTLLRHASSSPVIVSCPISDRCAGPALPSNATHLSEDPVQPASVSARLTAHALCAIHLADQRAPARRQYSVSMRVALSRAFADMARCVVPGIRRYGALRCRGHSPIWRTMLPRTLLLFGGASMGVQVFIDTGEFCVL